jgi:hypothetical protein
VVPEASVETAHVEAIETIATVVSRSVRMAPHRDHGIACLSELLV